MPSETDKQPPSLANSIVGVITACCFVMTTVVACHQFAPLAKTWWNAPRHCHCQECDDARKLGIPRPIIEAILEGTMASKFNAERLQRIERELLGVPSQPPTERPPVTPMPPIAPPPIQMPEI